MNSISIFTHSLLPVLWVSATLCVGFGGITVRGAEGGEPASTIFEDALDELCQNDDDPEFGEIDFNAPISSEDPNLRDGLSECLPGSTTRGCDKGMPVWRVSEPDVNLWISDTPLFYTTSSGRRMNFAISYKQRSNGQRIDKRSNFGLNWEASFISYIEIPPPEPEVPEIVVLVPAQGGSIPGSVTGWEVLGDFRRNRRIQQVGSGAATKYEVRFPSGGLNVYGFPIPHESGTRYFLTEKVDRLGRKTLFNYEAVGTSARLTSIRDTDGRITHVRHTNSSYPNAITRLEGPYYQVANGLGGAHFEYDTEGRLWRITDAAGLSATFQYTGNAPTLMTMTTPYGVTTFSGGDGTQSGNINRWLRVEQPDGSKHLYVFRLNSDLPENETSLFPSIGHDPELNIFGSSALNFRNTFYWGPLQYARLSLSFQSTENPDGLEASDYYIAHRKQWLRTAMGKTSHALNMEQLPRSDRASETPGHIVWYGYQGKSDQDTEGPGGLPLIVATRLPNGNPSFTGFYRDSWGRPLEITNTYTSWNGSVAQEAKRISSYTYEGFKLKDLSVDGKLRVSNTYYPAAPDQERIWKITVYHADGQGYETSYTYKNLLASDLLPGSTDSRRLDTRVRATGLKTAYAYAGATFPRDFLTSTTDSSVATQTTFQQRTTSYTYLKGNVQTHTDVLGYARTFAWDDLSRLTQINFPGHDEIPSSTIEVSYMLESNRGFNTGGTPIHILQMTRIKDRMEKLTYLDRDRMGRVTQVEDPLNQKTHFDFCGCGSLNSITDAMQQKTRFNYDTAGNQTNIVFQRIDETVSISITNVFNSLGQVTQVLDSQGLWIASYNTQGLLETVNNDAGLYHRFRYDFDDNVTQITSHNGVVVNQTFDFLGRLRTRQGAGASGLPETINYTARGLDTYVDQISKTTDFDFDEAGRKIGQTSPGDTLPYIFTYNAAGQLRTMTDPRQKITTWRYDIEGLLRGKQYNDQTFENLVYTYRADGLVNTRKYYSTPGSFRTTSYSYTDAGYLWLIDYPPETPDVTIYYNANNRIRELTDASGTTTFTYEPFGSLASETWNNVLLINRHNEAGLRREMELKQPVGSWIQSYLYDTAGRLQSLTAPSISATPFVYNNYKGAGDLWKKITLPTGATVERDFDTLGRLTFTALKRPDGTDLNRHGYPLYTDRYEVKRQTRTGGQYVDYTYYDDGQLWTATGHENDAGGTIRSQENLTYTYDPADNLHIRARNNFSQTFTVNDRNEITSIARTGPYTVAGSLSGSASSLTVQHNSGTASSVTPYADKTYAHKVGTLTDGNNTFNVTATSSTGAPDTANPTANFPATVSFAPYDSNGNLTGDGRRTFEYDDENQLKAVQVAGSWRSEFVYDGFGRLRRRIEKAWNGTAFVQSSETRYLYDGMRVIQERDANNNPLVTYTRGLDLSGSLGGAGGIGGLLARTDSSGTAYYHSDLGGNITALAKEIVSQDTPPTRSYLLVAKYLYDPYGNLLGKWGPLADANTYRFSSKEIHAASGLYYYGFRFYDPNLQRWLNRDPIGELGGVNLYGFAGNSAVNLVDTDGRFILSAAFLWHDLRSAMLAYQRTGRLSDAVPDLVMAGFDVLTLAADAVSGGTGGTSLQVARGGVAAIKVARNLKWIGYGDAAAVWGRLLPDVVNSTKYPDGASCPSGFQHFGTPNGQGRDHHSWPKYLGGDELQNLVSLPKWLHDLYHSGLDKMLPRQRGAAYYEGLTGAARDQALRDLADYTKSFDGKYGTELYDAMLKEGFPLP